MRGKEQEKRKSKTENRKSETRDSSHSSTSGSTCEISIDKTPLSTSSKYLNSEENLAKTSESRNSSSFKKSTTEITINGKVVPSETKTEEFDSAIAQREIIKQQLESKIKLQKNEDPKVEPVNSKPTLPSAKVEETRYIQKTAQENRPKTLGNGLSSTKTSVSARSDVSLSPTVQEENAAATLSRQENKSHYRTLTKTRKFVVDGVVCTSQSSRVVLSGDEDKKRLDYEKWKENLREMKKLNQIENREYQDLLTRTEGMRREQRKKFEMDMMVLFIQVKTI